MLSRVADAIYWMSRYIERADNVSRFISANFNLTLGLGGVIEEQWEPLLSVTGDLGAFRLRYDVADRANVIRFLVFDELNPNSIFSCVRSARENARSIREILSASMWHQVNQLYLTVNAFKEHAPEIGTDYSGLERLRGAIYMLLGVSETSMTHEEPWHFANLGRLLERADQTARMMDIKYFLLLPSVRDIGSPLDDVQWAAVLRSVNGLQMYRQRHGLLRPDRIVDFLVFDGSFPRAIFFCISNARNSLHAISGAPTGAFSNLAERRLGQLQADMAYGDAAEIIQTGLHEFLDGFQMRINEVGDSIYSTFFSGNPQQREYVEGREQ